MKLQIFYHGNCFDGAASAAIMYRFFRQKIDKEAPIALRPMMHRGEDPYGDDHDACFNADVNAVVDYRYSPSSRLTWWCDHHQSAFMKPDHKAAFENSTSATHCFDPTAPSCAGMMLRWLEKEHEFDGAFFKDLIRWADLIDAARFESPDQAVALQEPALQMMAVFERADQSLLNWAVEQLAIKTLKQVYGAPRVQQRLKPLLTSHREAITVFEQRMTVDNGVAFFDLTKSAVKTFNKFIPYYLADGIRYTVGLSATTDRVKISVGSNPWQRPAPLINLAKLCERYGGGGHPVVAAASFQSHQLAEATKAAETIAAILRGEIEA